MPAAYRLSSIRRWHSAQVRRLFRAFGKMEMNNHERFYVIFDGPELGQHRMDVRDLAPALEAIADLFDAANRQVNGPGSTIRVQAGAGFKEGSFGVDLLTVQSVLTRLRDMFAGDGMTAVVNAYALMVLLGLVGGGGLIAMLRTLAGKRPARIEVRGQKAIVWISDQQFFDIEPAVAGMYLNVFVRASLEKSLAPLEREGIDSLSIVFGDAVVLHIRADELGSFANDRKIPFVIETVAEKLLHIESVDVAEGNRLRVNDGQCPFIASVDDLDFLARIEAGEHFAKGDVLIVALRTIQRVVEMQLLSEYRIVEVREHRTAVQLDPA